MNLDPTLIAIAAAAACLVFGTGIFTGRRSGKVGERIRELTSKHESAAKERELAQASLEAAKAKIALLEAEHASYRGEVVDHFTGASDLMLDLTLQYRAVYDHLTQGATGLCPPGSVGLQQGLALDQLASGAAETPAETEPEAKAG